MFEPGQPWTYEDVAPLRDRLRKIRHDWRCGRKHGYPLCCVLTYLVATLLGVRGNARRRGSCKYGRPDGTVAKWVPCRWHMGRRRGPNWQPFNAEWEQRRRAYEYGKQVHKYLEDLAQRALADATREYLDCATFGFSVVDEHGERVDPRVISPQDHIQVGVDFGREPPIVVARVYRRPWIEGLRPFPVDKDDS